jgi:gamma-glutamyltranspeptidase/glutathione hydrolase
VRSSRTQTLSWPLLAWFCLAFGPGSAGAQGSDDAIIRYADLAHPQLGASGMVASQNYHASDAGAEILAAGGNAVDAAIAVGFSLAVSLPRAGNLGGGGFMLIHDANSGESIAIDYRERAPLRATRDMYLDEDGNVVPARSRYSHLAAGVPGTVAGLYMAYEKFGSLPWRRLLEPAIRQAREGVVMTYDLAELLKSRQGRMCSNEATCRYI